MGTKSQTQSTNQYNQPSMNAFNQMQPAYAGTLGQYAQNPFGNPFMQTQQQLGTRQAQNMNQSGVSNLMRNMSASGMMGGANSPAGLEMLQNQNRAGTANTANLGFLQPMQNAQAMQQFALGQQGQYRPLQTGGQQTQSTGGLGTWLPQVAGAAIGGLTGLAGMKMGGGGGSPESSFGFGQAMPTNTGSLSGGSLYNMPNLSGNSAAAFGGGGFAGSSGLSQMNSNPFLQYGPGGMYNQ